METLAPLPTTACSPRAGATESRCIICLEPWEALDPQVVRLAPCSHQLW